MSTTWFTSDLHIGHERVAQHRGFETTEAHDDHLAWEWDRRVTKRDLVYVLGDLCLSRPDEAIAWVADRPGTKVLIAGNHDACHPMHRGWRGNTKRYDSAFEVVATQAVVRVDRRRVMLSHFPYHKDHTDVPRYLEWRPVDTGLWLLHGHTHSSERWTSEREIHVGVDAWNYGPVSLAEISKRIRPATA